MRLSGINDYVWSFLIQDAAGAHDARVQFAKNLHELHAAGDLFGAELIFAELVNNATLHGRAPVQAWVERNGHGAVLHVRDGGDGFDPQLQLHPEPLTEGGRGLHIVRTLARNFTVRHDAHGTVAIAELPVT